ncbi:DUF3102 domain-containing protein [Ottowia pentelensis]|uniref:DUF3102 domain-containing protein n=1 Tax=Ottowia pentelensis TaxID=511108 RepID=A0ABV6PW61_9BURK
MSKEITIIENTTGEVTTTDLGELAERINMRVKAAEDRAKKAVEYVIDAGILLNEAKALVRHGEWDQWLAANCTVAPRTARAYMLLAKRVPTLPDAERQRVADLPVREAIKAITTDPTEPPRQHGVERIFSRDERERTAKIFDTGATALREATRAISNAAPIKPGKVQSLRNRLAAVLAELDKLTEAEPS